MDALILGAIDEKQKSSGIRGNLFEIGVHHGKSAALLHLLRAEGEQAGYCDLFSKQELNVDSSGKGSRQAFEATFQSLFGETPSWVLEKSSHELVVGDTSSDCRIFHVDGGHRVVDVVNDLRIANSALTEEGIAIIDDVFNPSWPSVSQGFHEYMSLHPSSFSPLIIGGNKVFLCRPDQRKGYSNTLGAATLQSYVSLPSFSMQTKEWYGVDVATAVRLAHLDLQPIAAIRLRLARGGWMDAIDHIVHRFWPLRFARTSRRQVSSHGSRRIL